MENVTALLKSTKKHILGETNYFAHVQTETDTQKTPTALLAKLKLKIGV